MLLCCAQFGLLCHKQSGKLNWQPIVGIKIFQKQLNGKSQKLKFWSNLTDLKCGTLSNIHIYVGLRVSILTIWISVRMFCFGWASSWQTGCNSRVVTVSVHALRPTFSLLEVQKNLDELRDRRSKIGHFAAQLWKVKSHYIISGRVKEDPSGTAFLLNPPDHCWHNRLLGIFGREI